MVHRLEARYMITRSPLLLFALLLLSSVYARAHSKADQECLALAMYWEARGESDRGMKAVGAVVLNRVADERFPRSACAVVKQGGERPPCQFSWWCDGKSDRPTNYESWQRAMRLAGQMLKRGRYDRVKGALFFHNGSVQPNWPYKRVARIGGHVFYR